MAVVTVKDLLESGVHFGHRVSRWNPKMEPFIFGKRNQIHIHDLRETLKGLIRAHNFLHRLAAEGKEILLVGTKRQAKAVVEAEAKRCNMPYVTERWLGGTLTNFETITRRLKRLEELERAEQDNSNALLKKKELAALAREKRKLLRNLEGIRHLKRLPGAVVLIDPRREHIALKEASKLGIPTVCLIDTDSDPDLVDIPIPGNDDAMRSIQVVLHHLVEGIIAGHKIAKTSQGIEIKRLEEESPEGRLEKPASTKRVVVRRVSGSTPAAVAPALSGEELEEIVEPVLPEPPAGEPETKGEA